MASAATVAAEITRLRRGPLSVRVDPDEVSAFREALDSEWGDGVPLTFPIRWRGLPGVREMLAELTAPGELLLHHSQTFEYQRQIQSGCEYQVETEGRREGSPRNRLVFQSSIRDHAGRPVADVQSLLTAVSRVLARGSFNASAKVPRTGSLLPSITFGPIDSRHVERYAKVSFDDNPVHLDDVAARAIGLKGRVVHGMVIMGLFERAASAWRPGLKVHRLHATFLQPAVLGSEIVFTGRVVQEELRASGTALTLRLFAHSASDDLFCIGEATGQIVRAKTGPHP